MKMATSLKCCVSIATAPLSQKRSPNRDGNTRARRRAEGIAGERRKLYGLFGGKLMKCLYCDDTGWVCETHPDQPWPGRMKMID
jgi:hypothetical protein